LYLAFFKNNKKSNFSKKADFTERDKGISPDFKEKKSPFANLYTVALAKG